MEERKRCCCNCRRNVRVEEHGGVNCYCDVDGHYISYVACFDDWCRHWAKEHGKATESVAPVVHGHWRTIQMACYGGGTIREYECSVCEEHQVSESPFCPNCGAKMKDGGA